MEEINDFQLFSEAFGQNGLSRLLTADRVAQAACFVQYLAQENAKYNLTAISDPVSVIYKHFVDSLLAQHLFCENAFVIDVGCGGGFPTIPLAIFRPDLRITAIDSTEKKIKFIKSASNVINLPVTAIVGRAEELSVGSMRESADIVTSRAVASLPILVELCLPFVRIGGYLIAMKGPGAPRELEEAKSAIEILGGSIEAVHPAVLHLPAKTTEQRIFLLIKKVKSTPAQYPRSFGQIKKKHL